IFLTLAAFSPGAAQESNESLKVTGSLPKSPLPPPATSGKIPLNAAPISPQTAPNINVPNSSASPFETEGSVVTLPRVFTRQWSLTDQIPPESLISERYIRSSDDQARALTLKEAIYIALRNNPSVQVALLTRSPRSKRSARPTATSIPTCNRRSTPSRPSCRPRPSF